MQINFSNKGTGGNTQEEGVAQVRKYLRQLERGLKSGKITLQNFTVTHYIENAYIEYFAEGLPTDMKKLEITFRANQNGGEK